MTDEITDSSGCVFTDLGIDKREAIMQRWDKWRKRIAEGCKASWPRDEFEMLLDAYDEEIARLKAELEEARR
jgi:hypothetical protein